MVRLIREALDDSRFHGVGHIFPSEALSFSDVSCDARTPDPSGLRGVVGIFCLGGFASFTFQQLQELYEDCPALDEDICVWESYAFLVLLRVFRDCLRGVHVRVSIDNSAAAALVNRGCASTHFTIFSC